MISTYIIFDIMGSRKGTVKSNSRVNALKTYCGPGKSFDNMITSGLIFAIDKADLETFKKQINLIK